MTVAIPENPLKPLKEVLLGVNSDKRHGLETAT